MAKVKDVMAAVEVIAPRSLALDGDPIGLHAGDPEKRVKRVSLALDAGLNALDAAGKMRAEMLLVHHPLFYRGLSSLVESDSSGRRALAIVRSGITVYSAHTNLDLAVGGTNDVLAGITGLREWELVVGEREERLLKLAVFVPADHVEMVRRAVCAAGAGAIGKYADCTFRSRGIGTFSCGEGTKPYQGRPGSFEEADEYRLETVFGEFSRQRVVDAMLRAHPYEEVAYDLYTLSGQGRQYGLGRVGELPSRETLATLAARMAKATGSTMAQYAGKPGMLVRRVAVWAGAGVDVHALSACRPDVVIAGEMSYHDIETFMDVGIGVVTLGHGFSEEPVLPPLAARLRKMVTGVEFRVVRKGFISARNV